MEVHDIVQETGSKTIPKKKKCKKAKWLSQEALQIAKKRREVKGKGEKERYTHLNAEFQRIARRDKKAFLSDQCKEIEENNSMGKTRDLFKKIRDTKGTFHARMGSIKDRNGMDVTEAEDIKKWQEYTEELYKKDHHDPDNHDGMITHLEPDILECEVKWLLGSITMNKASGADGIPVALFLILKDDVVKVLHSICQQIWKTQQWPQDWKRSVFIPIPKKGNDKESLNYCTIALISHASKVMLKILHARLQQYVIHEIADVQAGFRKGRGTRDQIANICWIIEVMLTNLILIIISWNTYQFITLFVCSIVQSCPSFCNPVDCSMQSRMPGLSLPCHLLKFAQVHVHCISDAIEPSHPLMSSSPALSLSQHQVFFQRVAVHIIWPKYWSFSFSISPSNEHSGLIFLKIDCFDLLAVQGTFRSLLQHFSLKASIFWCSTFFISHNCTSPLQRPYLDSTHLGRQSNVFTFQHTV